MIKMSGDCGLFWRLYNSIAFNCSW